MAEKYLNLERRINELPVAKKKELQQNLYATYDKLGIANKFNRWKNVVKERLQVSKMYAEEALVFEETLGVSLQQLFDPRYSLLDAYLKQREKKDDATAAKFGLLKAS